MNKNIRSQNIAAKGLFIALCAFSCGLFHSELAPILEAISKASFALAGLVFLAGITLAGLAAVTTLNTLVVWGLISSIAVVLRAPISLLAPKIQALICNNSSK